MPKWHFPLSYTSSLKKIPLSGVASPYNPLQGVAPPRPHAKFACRVPNRVSMFGEGGRGVPNKVLYGEAPPQGLNLYTSVTEK